MTEEDSKKGITEQQNSQRPMNKMAIFNSLSVNNYLEY